jgi:transposase
MDRFVLTDANGRGWSLCLRKPGEPGRSGGKDNRLFAEAVLRIAGTGSPWRDLPSPFGCWNGVCTRVHD